MKHVGKRVLLAVGHNLPKEFVPMGAVVTVSGTGAEQKITISNSTSMSKDDIDKAVKEAEQFAAEDKKRREAVDAKNEAENMAYQAEKLVNENGDKLPEEDKTALNTKAQAVKDACQKNDADLIKAAKEDLEKTLMSVSQKLYQQAAPQGQPQPGPAPDMGGEPNQGGDDGNVYDADFKDVD